MIRNIPQTRTFPEADIGSDHHLVMMPFSLRPKRAQHQTSKRITYNIDGFKSPNLMQQFNAVLGGKFLTDTDVDKLTNTFNRAISDTATEVLRKCQSKKMPWMTDYILALCEECLKLKKQLKESHIISEYRKCNNIVMKAKQEANGFWMKSKCFETEKNLMRPNNKEAYRVVKNLTTERKGKVSTIQDQKGNCLIEKDAIMSRWIEYCT